MKLQLEVGKYYMNRVGDLLKIVKFPKHMDWYVDNLDNLYFDNGTALNIGVEDLIKEIRFTLIDNIPFEGSLFGHSDFNGSLIPVDKKECECKKEDPLTFFDALFMVSVVLNVFLFFYFGVI